VPRVSFGKYHGLGNDFVVIDAVRGPFVTAAAARRICDRRRGVGADGVLSLLPPLLGGAIRMHIYNADGSEAEMCGNGLRCVVRKLLDAPGRRIAVETGHGILEGRLEGDGVRVQLGRVEMIDPAVEVDLDGRPVTALAISVGNPHLVLPPFPEDAKLAELAARFGPALERHPRFPERVNVEFVKHARDGLELVVFERGSGITEACGTGAAATAFASLAGGEGRSPVRVQLPGGRLDVLIEGDRVEIVGPAVHVFDGTIDLAEDEIGA
jgi:diaminopimelate epimerase